MNIKEWHHGCLVTVSDWFEPTPDDNTGYAIHIHVASYSPGAALSRPDWERSILVGRSAEQTVRDYLDSITLNIICSRW